MDGRVNTGLAVVVVVLLITSFFISMAFMMPVSFSIMQSQNYEMGGFYPYLSGLSYYYFITIVMGIILMILQLILLKQWMNVLNRNILNTQSLLASIKTDDVSVKSEIETASMEMKNEVIPGWAFWGYIISYLLTIVFSFIGYVAVIFAIVSLIFFLIYLHEIFSTSSDLFKTKSRVYSYLKNMKGLPASEEIMPVTRRNLFLVILLTIVTFGIYWLYLIIKLSYEINEYVKSDEIARVKFI